jgi:hypothetical protein
MLEVPLPAGIREKKKKKFDQIYSPLSMICILRERRRKKTDSVHRREHLPLRSRALD